MISAAVECHGVYKTFTAAAVVRDVSFSVQPGEIVALLGSSGCGKTTLLRLIAGFERLDQGTIAIAGAIVANEHRYVAPEKRRVGMVFQDYAIFPHLSVADNVRFGLKKGREADGRVAAMLSLVGLSELGDRMPHELSGGQQQRVALARALAPEPAVLLLDEPFSNLDANLRQTVRREVRELLKASSASAIFVTHDQEEAIFVGDRVAVMHAGYIEQIGTPEQIFHQPRTRFVAEFMGQTDVLSGEVVSGGIATALGVIQQLVKAPLAAAVLLAVRPDDVLLLEADRPNAIIRTRHFTGLDYLYGVELTDKSVLHSRQPHTRRLQLNTPIRVALDNTSPIPCFYRDMAV
jgi:iron(III) transport system ATP-binding protein